MHIPVFICTPFGVGLFFTAPINGAVIRHLNNADGLGTSKSQLESNHAEMALTGDRHDQSNPKTLWNLEVWQLQGTAWNRGMQ